MTIAFRRLPPGPPPLCRHQECRDRPKGARIAFWLVTGAGQPRAMCVSHCAAEAAAAGVPFPPSTPVT